MWILNKETYLISVVWLLVILQEIASSRSFDAEEERRRHALSDIGLNEGLIPDGESGDSMKMGAAFASPYFQSFCRAQEGVKNRGPSETDVEPLVVPTDKPNNALDSAWLGLFNSELVASESSNVTTTALDLKASEGIASNAGFIMSTSHSVGLNPTMNGSSNLDSGNTSQNSPQENYRPIEELSTQRSMIQSNTGNTVPITFVNSNTPPTYLEALKRRPPSNNTTKIESGQRIPIKPINPGNRSQPQPQIQPPHQQNSQSKQQQSELTEIKGEEFGNQMTQTIQWNTRIRTKQKQNCDAAILSAEKSKSTRTEETDSSRRKLRTSSMIKGRGADNSSDSSVESDRKYPPPSMIKSLVMKKHEAEIHQDSNSPQFLKSSRSFRHQKQQINQQQQQQQQQQQYQHQHQQQQYQHQQQQQQYQHQKNQQEKIPKELIPVEKWKSSYRLPTAYAPIGEPLRFSFPTSSTENSAFLEQLYGFQEALKRYQDQNFDSEGCRFENYRPQLNVVRFKDEEELYTNSPLVKVFDAPPLRQWIPVRCDALGMKFETKEGVSGHAGRPGGKTHVSIVYNVFKPWKDEAKTEELVYIRKTYTNLEYFTNEYNFFQFAHHRFLPKPYCVEYGTQPSIVMEFVEGGRVNSAFYELAKDARKKHKQDVKKIWEVLEQHLIDVVAKLMLTLRYIHTIGFIHADLKPENVIYNPLNGRVVVIDFDFSVSAPYLFAGRGSANSIAPELNGLVKGPTHFGIDWWGFGSTVAIVISSIFAGILYNAPEKSNTLNNYVPFRFDQSRNAYTVTHIPEYFPQLWRSFLYPFFSADPVERNFSEANAFNWIRRHPIFGGFNWARLENPEISIFSDLSPTILGFISFSRRPHLLRGSNRGMFEAIASLLWKGYSVESRPIISAFIRDSDMQESGDLLGTLINYYRAEADHQSILSEFYPGSVLHGQDMLKKVANVVGLELPKSK